MICESLELYDNDCGGYDYYCMITDSIADPNECIKCPYLLDKNKSDEYYLKVLNEGSEKYE